MKTKKRNNFILLALAHLLFFGYPMVVGMIHMHHGEAGHEHCCEVISFHQPENHCPVCEYEFYNFLAAPAVSIDIDFYGIPVYDLRVPGRPQIRQINYFSLRAPPPGEKMAIL